MKNTFLVFLDYHIGEFNFIFPVLLDLLDDPRNRVHLLFTKSGVYETIHQDPYLPALLRHRNLRLARFYCRAGFRNRLLSRICGSGRWLPLQRWLARLYATMVALLARRDGAVFVGLQLECPLRLFADRGIHYVTYAHATDSPTLPPEHKGAFTRPDCPLLPNADFALLCYLRQSASYYIDRGFRESRIIECGVGSVANLYRRIIEGNDLGPGAARRVAFLMCYPQEEWLNTAAWIRKSEQIMQAIEAVFPDFEVLANRHPNTLPDGAVDRHLEHLKRRYNFHLTTTTQHSLIASSRIIIGFGTSAFFPAVVRTDASCCYFNAVSDAPDVSVELVNGRWVVVNPEEFVACVDTADQFADWLVKIRDENFVYPPNRLITDSIDSNPVRDNFLDKIRIAYAQERQ